MDKFYVNYIMQIKFRYQFSMENLLVSLIFVKNIYFSIKPSIKILKIIYMTSQMAIRFRGAFFTGHELRNPYDADGYPRG